MNESIPSWKAKPALHQPAYRDPARLRAVIEQIRELPPLIFAPEADALMSQLAAAGEGRAFVLQGGDCAESFATSGEEPIRAKVRTILQMAIVLTYSASVPVVKIGRIAGQYAKPRTHATEVRHGVALPSYFGDAVNGYEFTAEARMPDPGRLLTMYSRSAASLNLIRALSHGGFADVNLVHEWNRGFARNAAYERYNEMAEEIDRALRFISAAGAQAHPLTTVNFYSSHEALLLDYEDALIRPDALSDRLYDTSAHFLWIGERTRDPEGAHVELLSQVANPIGVKIGPNATPGECLRLIDRLNPDGVPGRLTFITRMGAGNVRHLLPAIVEAVRSDGRPVTWICDPMHGNTFYANGFKTRRMADVLAEIAGFFDVHRAAGTVPGGIHIELTGDDVTEVLGGSNEILEEHLPQRYETLVDPRLNHEQALELAFEVAQILRDRC
ncbi:3-deoxy-7-phosphoheptulonate synthase [Arcanobacterium wilhelmae]|uniref:Phospho-2-dehydro-3-deoxyheptonate aldolase n=1 Tax=Arcanobacterium wilhelmae TaxID=1803177 RepID=A0ABT9N8Z6_9ACTO|nr:3-deoxy-7-phosphoheptulonate synthase class II [Arcanobacterium wilhelmae]MDP9800174.1 3-deoxy-7-phosphoheptulonate synthase [Arcanobacterium wilhelmae]WFN89615.1 3-deoxy-7-phosphoheptulonate synthase class II [Arcanobacterium wilhelmae]